VAKIAYSDVATEVKLGYWRPAQQHAV